jgi:hypothetical protein
MRDLALKQMTPCRKFGLRLSRSNADEIENLGSRLSTVVARICLDMSRFCTAKL